MELSGEGKQDACKTSDSNASSSCLRGEFGAERQFIEIGTVRIVFLIRVWSIKFSKLRASFYSIVFL